MSELGMLNAQQKRLRDLERTDRSVFQLRAQAALLGIPAHRALWSMTSVDYQRPECGDIGPWGYHLQSANALGDVLFSYDTANVFAPIAVFTGVANSYLFRADGGAGNWADILGTEIQVRAAEGGLTLGGWFWWSAPPGAIEVIVAKDDAGANRQYLLFVRADDTLRFTVWPGPVSATSVGTVQAGWNHCIGIYDQPSQTQFVVLNGVVTSGGVGASPAALVDTAAPFTIGGDGAGGNLFTGYASMCLLSACSVSQTAIRGLRQEQRNVFGV